MQLCLHHLVSLAGKFILNTLINYLKDCYGETLKMKRKLLHKNSKCDTIPTKEKLKNYWYTKSKLKVYYPYNIFYINKHMRWRSSKKLSVAMQKVGDRYLTLLTACFLIYPKCFGRVNGIMHYLS